MYIWSDAWFLLSVSNNASLEDIIASGDYRNHAIFTLEEINHALTLLIQNNYICLNENKTVKLTSRINEVFTEEVEKTGVFSQADKLLINMNKQNGMLDIETSVEYFNKDEFDNAYNCYWKRSLTMYAKLEKGTKKKK